MTRQIKHWVHRRSIFGPMWSPVYEERPAEPSRIWKFVVVITLITTLTILGYLTGFVDGYNDKLAEHIAKYRVAKKMR